MHIKNLKDCPEFISGDKAILRELLLFVSEEEQ